MNALIYLAREPSLQRLGWVLIHFLWQGTAIGLALAVLLPVLNRTSSHLRYLVICAALLACAVAPAITWAVLAREETVPHRFRHATAGNLGLDVFQTDQPSLAPPRANPLPLNADAAMPVTFWRLFGRYMLDELLPYAVIFWFGGVLVLTVRLAFGWAGLQRLRRSGTVIPDSRLQEKFRSLTKRMRVSAPVRLLHSALVEVPTLIGWLRPAILLPAAVFTGLTPGQIEAVLAHELAHVRRCDYLANLLQTVIETTLFYHPAVWWISGKLREEREVCCDDLAIEVMQDRLIYVSALARLEEARTTPMALAASGGSLLRRIRRIARKNDRKATAWPLLLVIIGILVIACLPKGKASEKAAPHYVGDLSFAAASGNVAKVGDLLKKGADVNEMDDAGQTPFSYAVRRGQVEAAKLLLQNGANVNLFDNRDMNPYVIYALFSHEEPGMMRANWGLSEQEAKPGLAAFKDLFAKYPPDPNYKDAQGRTILQQAVLNGNTLTVELLLAADNKYRPDPNLRNPSGRPPVLLAALSPRASETGAGDSVTIKGKIAGEKATSMNREAFIADQLIKAGAKLDLLMADGKTVGELALEAARKANNLQLISVLETGVAKTQPTSSQSLPTQGSSSATSPSRTTKDADIHAAKPLLYAHPEPYLSDDEIEVIRSNHNISGYSVTIPKEHKTDAQDWNASVSFFDVPHEERDRLAKMLVDPHNYDSSPFDWAGDNTTWILVISDGTHLIRLNCGKKSLLISGVNNRKVLQLHLCLLNDTGATQLHAWIKAAADKYGRQEAWYFQNREFGDFMTTHEMDILRQNQ